MEGDELSLSTQAREASGPPRSVTSVTLVSIRPISHWSGDGGCGSTDRCTVCSVPTLDCLEVGTTQTSVTPPSQILRFLAQVVMRKESPDTPGES